MRRFFCLLTLFSAMLFGGELHLTLDTVSDDGTAGTIKTARVEPGVSGFLIRHFTPEHSAIIANAVVSAYDEAQGIVHVDFSEYTGLRQNSLPKGEWQPAAGDEVILAFAYDRATLLAPNADIYRKLTSRINTVDWVHPDTLATYLSYKGHPTPIKADLSGFCSVMTAGLLMLYLDDALFTVDCHSLAVLQISQADLTYENTKLPFYSRVKEIDANWFGEGSGELDSYEPYYYELLVENNPHSRKLYDFIQSHPSVDRQLLDEFDLKGQP